MRGKKISTGNVFFYFINVKILRAQMILKNKTVDSAESWNLDLKSE